MSEGLMIALWIILAVAAVGLTIFFYYYVYKRIGSGEKNREHKAEINYKSALKACDNIKDENTKGICITNANKARQKAINEAQNISTAERAGLVATMYLLNNS